MNPDSDKKKPNNTEQGKRVNTGPNENRNC